MTTPVLNNDDIDLVRDTLTSFRALSISELNIILIRGNDILPAQKMTVDLNKQHPRLYVIDPVVEFKSHFIITGSMTLDIKVGDRFTYNGQFLRVDAIDPDTFLETTAFAEGLE